MPNSNYIVMLDHCVSEFKTSNELTESDSETFELFVGTQLTKQFDLSHEEMASCIVDGGKDGGIDAFYLFADDRLVTEDGDPTDYSLTSASTLALYIVQSKTESTFKETAIEKLTASCLLLFDLNLDLSTQGDVFNAKVIARAQLFRRFWIAATKKGAAVQIKFVYACKSDDGYVSPSFEAKKGHLVDFVGGRIYGGSVEFLLLGAKSLLDLYKKRRVSQLELLCSETPTIVSYGEGSIGCLAVVALRDYYRFVTDDNGMVREDVFEDNVRHYQGKIDVNTALQSTLEFDYERDFWWLNIGITIICSGMSPFGKKLVLNQVQIVNGLQTSYSIAKYYNPRADDNRSVVVKVIATTDKESIDRIIKATNSQSPVNAASLRSTDDLQRDVETFFLQNGYFYDRRKNYYRNQGKPASKIFSIQFAAQSIEAVLNRDPASARSSPTLLLREDRNYRRIFFKPPALMAYLKSCLIVQKTSSHIRSSLDDTQREYVANFGLHMSRIVASLVTNKVYYSTKDVENINIDDITGLVVKEAFFKLEAALSDYMSRNPRENIINISKSKRLSEEISEWLGVQSTDESSVEQATIGTFKKDGEEQQRAWSRKRSSTSIPVPHALPLSEDRHWYSINDGQVKSNKKAKDILVNAFRDLAEQVPDFLEKYFDEMERRRAGKKGVRRRWLAKSREELYQDQRFIDQSEMVVDGWFIGTHYSNSDKVKMLRIAQDIAGASGVKFEFHIQW